MGSLFGGKGGSAPAAPQMQMPDMSGQMTQMMQMMGTMMSGMMQGMSQMMQESMTAQQGMMEQMNASMMQMPEMPEAYRNPEVDWSETTEDLAKKASAEYSVDDARRKGTGDTVLTSPLLDEEEEDVTGSILAEE